MDFNQLLLAAQEHDYNSLQKNSRKMYEHGINVYKNFFRDNFPNINPFPPTEENVRVFIHVMKMQGKKFNTLRNYIAAIRHYFSEIGGVDPTKSPSFKKFYNGLRREMYGDKPPNRKEPVLPEHMQLFSSLINEDIKDNVQTMALFSLLFFGFFRISEVWQLHVSDINFLENDLTVAVTIISSKTDVNGRSETVYIKQGEKAYDCYKWLKKYYDQNCINAPPDMKLFPISIAEMRSRIHNYYKRIGIDSKNYSCHSFRRGGAHAAAIAGVQDCSIKRHGRWKSSCYTIYTAVEMQEAGREISIKI